jgi:hypothetical protein
MWHKEVNMVDKRIVTYIEDNELFKKIIKYGKDNNLSRSEVGNIVFKEYFDNQEKEWQVLFKAIERLNRRLEKVEVGQTTNLEALFYMVQILFMAIPHDYNNNEFNAINERTERAMNNFIREFKKSLDKGGVYSPKLKGLNIED